MKYYYVSFLWTHSIKISPRYYFHWNYFITSTFKILIILPREALFCVQKNHSIEQNTSHPTGRAAVYKCKITVNSGHILHWIFISSMYIQLDFFHYLEQMHSGLKWKKNFNTYINIEINSMSHRSEYTSYWPSLHVLLYYLLYNQHVNCQAF